MSDVAGTNLSVVSSRPSGLQPTGRRSWYGAVENLATQNDPIFFVVYVVCAEVAT